ncbi:hypothetical protein EDC01DRAFT_615222 [Geopyxis carbonaria]|nr:hypothetical protein EDC01DRAFT_615222 [Geopyxis carbonaria]
MVRAGIKEAHPAGIWTDMSSDGPTIGTLVVVLDRAKNLPNKKKIGKQDPYAVARLAKEAKRTDTDVRGGQVPRWDKELRFPVRDSPDYKTLKISVFNDDKKTDLIGECTLRLDKILVKGGGTDDGWRGLKCKEKYAGEILVELTFWDLRPKETSKEIKKKREVPGFQEKPKEAPRRLAGAREMGSGAREMPSSREKTVKRRPLPANPMAREASSSSEDVRKERRRDRETTRKSRHSYHPDAGRSKSRRRRSPDGSQLRHSASRMVMTPAAQDPGRTEIYDPYGDNNDYGALGRPNDFIDQYDAPPPPPPSHGPPPPTHGMPLSGEAPPMHQSISSGHPELPQHQFEQPLRHFKSVPAFQPEMTPRLDEYGREYPQQSYALQPPVLSPANVYEPSNSYEEVPQLSYGSTPVSAADDAPPPPPPPHRQQNIQANIATPVLPSPAMTSASYDEPNWDNLRPKSQDEEHGLPPTYEAVVAMPTNAMVRRSSFINGDMSPERNGIPIPPSLIPGINPVIAEQMAETERRFSTYNSAVQPLRIEHHQSQRSNTNYHRPQVEEVQDIQLYQQNHSHELPTVPVDPRDSRAAPMVKPLPIHGEKDTAVPVIGATMNSLRKNSALNVKPERKPLPGPMPEPERTLGGTPFGPESYDLINPNPIASLNALEKNNMPNTMITPGTNRVLDPSDVLPPHTFAPEPERRRAPRAPPPVPVEHRRERFDRGSMRSSFSSAAPRGPRLSLPAPQPQIIKQVSFEDRQEPRRQRSVRASQSMAVLPSERKQSHRYSMGSSSGGMVLFDPNSERERERQMERDYAERDSRALVPSPNGHENYGYRPSGPPRTNSMEVDFYGRSAPPPLPAKVPMQAGSRGMNRETLALSQELSMINIGLGDGGSRRTRRY